MPSETVIGQRTKLELTLVVAVCGLILTLAGIGWGFDKRLTRIEDALESTTSDRWTLTSQSEHSLRMQLGNLHMRVPDPRNPGKYLDAIMRESGSNSSRPSE